MFFNFNIPVFLGVQGGFSSIVVYTLIKNQGFLNKKLESF